ncbi:hypothetical protein [Actinokineospora inagensis]|uniref:Rv0361 family membrane protein n=1 Tax=Actinokineospora inagensis TaxID=103730 RepID=UPI000404A05D|nr:hypothetical protein [Actinokineospora inagensis]
MTHPPQDPSSSPSPHPGDQGGGAGQFPEQTRFLPADAFPGQDPHGQSQQPAHPQQPGQPGQFPQSGQFTQGHQPHPGQFPPPGQVPPGQFPAGQVPPGQFPQQGGYPPQGAYPQQQPGYPQNQYGQPYPQRRNRLPWILAGGGLVVIGVVVTLVLTLSGSDTGSARGTTEAILDALVSGDADAYNKLVCNADDKVTADQAKQDQAQVTEPKVQDVTETGDTATATISAKVEGETRTVRLRLKKANGTWCVDKFSG